MSTLNLTVPDEETRTSLLDIVKDGLQRQGKTSMLYRVVLVGESTEPKNDVGAHYQKFFKNFQQESELITGLLILHPTTWIHILEASHTIVLQYLREVLSPQSRALVRKVKVILVAEDVPNRFFPFWASRQIDYGVKSEVERIDNLQDDELAKTASDLCISLLNLGTSLSNLSKSDMKAALDTLSETFKAQIPKSDLLATLANSKNIIGLEEWYEQFHGLVNWTAESELVWPALKTRI